MTSSGAMATARARARARASPGARRSGRRPSPGPPRPRPRERASPSPRRPPPLLSPRGRAPPLSPGRCRSASAGRVARPGAVPGSAARVWAFPLPPDLLVSFPLCAAFVFPTRPELCASREVATCSPRPRCVRSGGADPAGPGCPGAWGLRRADAEGEEEGYWNAERCPCWKRFFIFSSRCWKSAFARLLRPARPSPPSLGAAGRTVPHAASSNAALRPRLGEVAVRRAARGARPAGRGAAGRASRLRGSGRFPLRDPH